MPRNIPVFDFNIKFNDKDYRLIAVIILFIAWFFTYGPSCPCGKRKKHKIKGCYRFEIMGVQTNHLYFFIFLGYFFPEYFFTIQGLGVLWELFEMYLDHNERFASRFGGCLSERDITIGNSWYNDRLVVAGEKKYLNPIDRLFGIKNSTVHSWHGSVAELFVNLIGFAIGAFFSRRFTKYGGFIVTLLVVFLVGLEVFLGF